MKRAYSWTAPSETPKYPVSELVTKLVGSTPDGGVVIRTEQQVEQIAREAAYYRNYHPANGFSRSGERQLVAMLPMAVGHMLLKKIGREEFFGSGRKFEGWLNSSEARPWRTSTGDV